MNSHSMIDRSRPSDSTRVSGVPGVDGIGMGGRGDGSMEIDTLCLFA